MTENAYGRPFEALAIGSGAGSAGPANHNFESGVVLIAPLGAPLPEPAELLKPVTGTLYARLAKLTAPEEQGQVSLVLLSGPELDALSGAWSSLVEARVIYALTGLPGQVSDVLFDHSALAIGLRRISWAEVEATLLERARTAQRRADTDPSSGTDVTLAEVQAVGTGIEPVVAQPRGFRSHKGLDAAKADDEDANS